MILNQLALKTSGKRISLPWEKRNGKTVSSFILSIILARDRFIQLIRDTPQRLASIYPQHDPMSTRCYMEPGTFWHMVWSCSKIWPYWEAVAETLSDISGLTITLILLLSHLKVVEGDRYAKLCLTFTLFYARREILIRWKSVEPPTRASWLQTVNAVLPLYRITYKSRHCPTKFDKIWSNWIDACG